MLRIETTEAQDIRWVAVGCEVPVMREHRWPGPAGEPDIKSCEHYVPARDASRAPEQTGGAQ